MKQKNTLLLTGLLAFAALAPMSAQAHGPKHNDGIRLATDIVNLVGASVRLLNPYPIVVTPAPVVVQTPVVTTTTPVVVQTPVVTTATPVIVQPAPVVIQEPIVIDPVYVPRRPRYVPPRPRFEPMPGPRFERPHRGPHHDRPMPPRGGRGGRGGRGDW